MADMSKLVVEHSKAVREAPKTSGIGVDLEQGR